METIERAALMKDGVVYDAPRPGRHNHVIHKAHTELGLSTDPMEPLREDSQGFVTSTGRYVRREEAAAIALAAGQISAPKQKLFSEDVW